MNVAGMGDISIVSSVTVWRPLLPFKKVNMKLSETIRNCLKLPAIDGSGIAVPLLRKALAVKGRRGNASDDVPAMAVIW